MTGEQLKAWRISMGMKNQTDAAKALGVPYRTYQRWEKAADVGRVVELATQALSITQAWPGLVKGMRAVGALVRGH